MTHGLIGLYAQELFTNFTRVHQGTLSFGGKYAGRDDMPIVVECHAPHLQSSDSNTLQVHSPTVPHRRVQE